MERARTWRVLMAAWLAAAGIANAQMPGQREPRIGYAFPAGAAAGSSVELLLGGQILRGSSQVVVSGQGVEAKVLKAYRPTRNLDKEQRDEIQRRIAARRAVLAGRPVPPVKPRPADAPAFVMPEHPFLDRLDRMDAAELDHWVQVFLRANRQQQNVQLSEMVTLQVRVDPKAQPGLRELRLVTSAGLTNPVRFDVGHAPEACEREPNDPKPWLAPSKQVSGVPVVFNGQVLPGDVDRLRFHARGGQSLVVEVKARSLVPYLADAVPGWFQPVVAVFDAEGKELAYADDFRFLPDPVLLFRPPAEGDYTLEIRDSIFRGREDFVYRISVSEQPFVTSCFPLGASAGSTVKARLAGWNLPRAETLLDTDPGGPDFREVSLRTRAGASNPVRYAVDELPDAAEGEPNDSLEKARAVPWPCVVNGRIDKPGDVDVFRIAAPAGSSLSVETMARRLASPLDSVVRVLDARGKVIAWNDDTMLKEGHLHLGDGLLTHHADSQVAVKLPSEGPFFVSIEDTQRQGGEAWAYRLRVSPPRPDFALRVVPSGISVAPGQSVPVSVFVDRRDGFDGPVELAIEGADGWTISGQTVPAGLERLRVTVQAPPRAEAGVQSLHLTGKARIGTAEVMRMAEPCDDAMQAFLWRHLVPADEWLAVVPAGRGKLGSPATRIGTGPVLVKAGGEGVLRYRVPVWIAQRGVQVAAIEVPPGLAVRSEVRQPDEVVVRLTAAAGKLKPGPVGNAILGASFKLAKPDKNSKSPKATLRPGANPMMVLPAVPVVIQPQSQKP